MTCKGRTEVAWGGGDCPRGYPAAGMAAWGRSAAKIAPLVNGLSSIYLVTDILGEASRNLR